MVTLLAARESPVLWVIIAGGVLAEALFEGPTLWQIYERTPTPLEYFAARPIWKKLAALYGFSLAVLAIWLLTIGQDVARRIGEHFPILFSLILGPPAVGFAAHQHFVFKALADETDA